MNLNSTLAWFQNKIGTYDKQVWEQCVEKSILKGFGNIPKKSAKVKTDLIDVDFVRGSTFPKAKPQHGVLVIARKAICRTVLLPFFWSWWTQQTNRKFALLLIILYILQCSAIAVYGLQSPGKEWEDTSLMEVLSPLLLMIVVGTIYSQVVSTSNLSSSNPSLLGNFKRKRVKRRRSTKTKFTKSSVLRRQKNEVHTDETLLNSASGSVGIAKHFSGSHFPLSKDHLESPSSPDSAVASQTSRNLTTDLLVTNDVVSQDLRQCDNPSEDQTSDEARHDSAIHDVSSVDLDTDARQSDTEAEHRSCTSTMQANNHTLEMKQYLLRRRMSHSIYSASASGCHDCCNSSCESEMDTGTQNSPSNVGSLPSEVDWGMTTNTDCENSYGSDTSGETEGPSVLHKDPSYWECQGMNLSFAFSPSSSTSDKGSRFLKVSCTIWEGCECKKADLSVLDITSTIVHKVSSMPESTDYFVCGICFAVMMALVPTVYRTHETARDLLSDVTQDVLDMSIDEMDRVKDMLTVTFLENNFWLTWVTSVVLVERFFLSLFFFFLLSVAERTFKQRFLYAKLFSHITSSRRARRSELPHFRLNKVRNIKSWLSVRSYLKKHGPQRSVDVIVSASFVIVLLLISFLCIQILKESDHFGDRLYNWDVLAWSLALGVYLLRFMTLGAKTNNKYRNLSVLLTEQINLYVQMEQKPQKKEGLVLANNVLKLASQLLKELESPFKISGFSANPFLYNITKLVILSAFSAVLTELLGFKLKLYKIKLK